MPSGHHILFLKICFQYAYNPVTYIVFYLQFLYNHIIRRREKYELQKNDKKKGKNFSQRTLWHLGGAVSGTYDHFRRKVCRLQYCQDRSNSQVEPAIQSKRSGKRGDL